MKKPTINFLKHPPSLKWKWPILLFAAFMTLSIGSLIAYQRISVNHFHNQVKEVYQERLMDLSQELASLERPINSTNFVDPSLSKRMDLQQRLVRLYVEKNVDVRVYTPEGRLVYESQPYALSYQKTNQVLTDKKIQGKQYLVGNERVISPSSNKHLGSIQMIVSMDRMEELMRGQYRDGRIALIVYVLLSLGLAYIISYYFLKPLSYINNTLDLLEEGTLSEVRLMEPRSNDEWSDLCLHLNRLLDKIDQYVTNQKQFVEDVSHELRTPVAIVEGHLKMLNRWGKEDQTVLEESIAASLQEITRMKDLVQEMLDLSRADHVDVDYKNEMTEVVSTTKQVFNNFVMLYPDFKIFLDAEKSQDPIYVNMFRNHFEQILIILMDNAVKYSTNRKEIHLSLSKGVNKVEIAVQDFGEGMREEDKERVFGRFYRVDKARARNQGGNGLGLSIAKQLVESYRGQIRLESVYGHGSIFYVEFPIMTDQRAIYKNKQAQLEKEIK